VRQSGTVGGMSPGPPPATAGPVLWKEGAPYIGGDLPQGWTPARKPVANGTVAIDDLPDGGLVYRIAIAGSELSGPLKPIGTRPPSTAGAPLLPPR
jgi:hypothetical protein